MNKVIIKINFYMISILPLLGLILLRKILLLIDVFYNNNTFYISQFLLVPLVLICILYTCFILYKEKDFYKTSSVGTIIEIKNQDYNYLAFFIMYMIPFLDKNDILIMVILAFIGLILIKTDLFYNSPSLALFGYKLYKVKLEEHSNTFTIISKDDLYYSQSLRYVVVDDMFLLSKIHKE